MDFEVAPWSLRPHLVLDAGVVCARRAEMVAIEVGQVVVVALVEVDQLAVTEPETAARPDE